MKILELFAGTCSFSTVAKTYGHQTFTSDNDSQFDVDYVCDILAFDSRKLPFTPDVIWASPPCEGFSVASIGKHWYRDNTPKSEKAVHSLLLVEKTQKLIDELKPKYWIIENPRGKLRKLALMEGMTRYTVTYCQYGDTRMKPTDIWTNVPWTPRPMCKNGADCHVSAPRGSKTGTQGIATYKDRSRIPKELCDELIQALQAVVPDKKLKTIGEKQLWKN